MASIRRNLSTSATPVDGQSRRFKFIASTEQLDRAKDRIIQGGWQLERYRTNPIMLWQHDRNLPPIAKCIDIRVSGGDLIAVAEFPPETLGYQLANVVCGLLRGGYLNAVSVGFSPIESEPNSEGGWTFLSQHLDEISIVALPCNTAALAQRGLDQAVQKWFRDAGEAVAAKSGRAISAANAEHIAAVSRELCGLDSARHGHMALSRESAASVRTARAHLQALHAATGSTDDAPDDEDVLDVDDEDTIDEEAIASVLPGVVKDVLAAHVAREVGVAVTRLRGRTPDLDGGAIDIDTADIARVMPGVIRAALRDAVNGVVAHEVTAALRRARGRLD